MGGVLRSWAVPKGPSPDPADKRLAVRVEDHPLEYAAFEGRIPEGNYGAGAVIVWDRGSWVPLTDPDEGLQAGKLLFELNGYKLRGKWTLVKTKRGDKDWLLIKERDSFVSDTGTDGYPMDSILSGQSVAELKKGTDPSKPILRKLRQLGAPDTRVSAKGFGVMLAQSGKAFSKPGWLFEIKYDGYRLVACRDEGEARLYSRAGNDLTGTFPEIAGAVAALPFRYLVMDAEAVVHDTRGIPSFGRLQRRGRLTRRVDIQRASVALPATLYVFDLVGFDAFDLRSLPLETRKSLLKRVLPSVGPLRYSDGIEEHGLRMYAEACKLGLEGIVAKRVDSLYRAGRTAQWIKVSAERRDDFIIVGFTEPKQSGPGFGALLLAAYDSGELTYLGRVGSGFSQRDQVEIFASLQGSAAAAQPKGAPQARGQRWLETGLVCEVKFKEITAEGLLRQPVFLRLRDDKQAAECLREARPGLPEPAPETGDDAAQRSVQLTNPDKVFWPDEQYTKGDLIEFYRRVSEWLLPYLEGRPVVLDRYPDGINGKSFFQKDAPQFAPDWIRTERMWSEHSEREISYFIVEDEAALLYIINLGTIPLHIWSSRVGSLERPDWCILDLDPKDAPFSDVIEIAKSIHTLCEEIELPSFVKTSGSSGLHVLIPLGAQYTYEQSRTLGEVLARIVCAELPGIATVTRAPSKREGRVYIDTVQNGHGRLLVSTFSARPLPGATVSMPLNWRELNAKLQIGRFTIKNAARRMRSMKHDPMRDVLNLQPDLSPALERLRRLF